MTWLSRLLGSTPVLAAPDYVAPPRHWSRPHTLTLSGSLTQSWLRPQPWLCPSFKAWQWRSPEDFPEVLCPRETLVVEVARDSGDGTESRQAASAPALHTAGPSCTAVAGRPETRGLGQHCPRGGLAHERLPLLLGGVTQGAATFGDLWWTQRTDEPAHSGRPVGQAD